MSNPVAKVTSDVVIVSVQVCASYPQLVIVPKAIDDETLCRAATFRQAGRFPVLSYFHKDNQVMSLIISFRTIQVLHRYLFHKPRQL